MKATALEMIAEERQRQMRAEGYTTEHDDEHDAGELATAAGCYALRPAFEDDALAALWPWDQCDWKPTPDDRIRELVKAGALILAEIQRLQRAEKKGRR